MAHSIQISSLYDQIQTKKDEIEEGRKVDNLVEIKVTNGQDSLGSQTNKSANQIFAEMFEDLDNSSIKSCTIFKVNVGLRESNPDAYIPNMVSIGPYHKKNPEFRLMEKYKLLYLRRFLLRKEGLDVESCIRQLKELKEKALKCYEDIEDLKNDSQTGQFLQMLLLDGCFVVEFIRESFGVFPEGEEKIIKVGCIYNQIVRDLLLLENQLPFFVLTKLHDMTKKVNESPLAELVSSFTFLTDLPIVTPASFIERECNEGNIKHLLHVVHMSCHGNPSQITRKKDKNLITLMPNARELSDAGVSFVKVGKLSRSLDEDNRTSLFDIKFKNGLMKIPCFRVVDLTETILRNLVAYEQQSSDVHPRYFTDFVFIMDHIIESDKDVNLLRQEGIIENWIGEDKEVAIIFNRIGKGVTIASDFYYKEEFKRAVQYCEKPWNKRKASLKSNYFNSPWAGISTGAAIILLILTVMQTVLAFTGGIK